MFELKAEKKIKRILTKPTGELGKAGRFLVFQIKLWPRCIRLLKQNKCGQMAAALSYHTLFGIVPLAIVMLMVFQALPAYKGIGDEVKNFVYDQLRLSDIKMTVPGEENAPASRAEQNTNAPQPDASAPEPAEQETRTVRLTDKIDQITENFISNLNKGLITLIGSVVVVWAALGLLMTIERSFNMIWHVTRGRGIINKIINYWALLTLGPLLLGLGIYVSTTYLIFQQWQDYVGFLRPVIPYLISVVALFFLYYMMPNTKVEPAPALWGAAIAALLWSGSKALFGIYLTRAVLYSKIYGIMGLVPLGVLWIYISWLIVLLGLILTYATQNLNKLDEQEIAQAQRGGDYFMVNDFTIIRILQHISEQFDQRRAPVRIQQLCKTLDLPIQFGQEVADHLVKHNLLLKTDEPDIGYVPATDCSNITLQDIAEAAKKGSFMQDDRLNCSGKFSRLLDDYHKTLASYTLRDIIDKPDISLDAHDIDPDQKGQDDDGQKSIESES